MKQLNKIILLIILSYTFNVAYPIPFCLLLLIYNIRNIKRTCIAINLIEIWKNL